MTLHNHNDIDNLDLLQGDWVRVIMAPLTIQGMPKDSLAAFSDAIGKTFQIQEFDEIGCLHLESCRNGTFESIYIEPFCVRRFRRYKKHSKAFQEHLDFLNTTHVQAIFEINFEAILKPGIDLDDFGNTMIKKGTGGGYAVYPEQRKISGSICVEVDEPNAKDIIAQARTEALEMSGTKSLEVSEMIERIESY